MPTRPPLCPAFTHSQSLTLSPILETVYSPLQPHENQLFDGFAWTGLLSPPDSATNSPNLSSGNPAGHSRLDHLTQQYAKIAGKNSVPSKQGLGFDLHVKLSGHERRHSSISTYTPPGSAYKRINDAFTAAAESRRRSYSSYESFNYEEDDADLSEAVAASYDSSSSPMKEDDSRVVQNADKSKESNVAVEDEGDLLPLHTWLQTRMEESLLREQFEAESETAISTLTAASSIPGLSSTTSFASIASVASEATLPESATLVDIQTAVLQQRKVVKVNHKAVASLRNKASVLNTPPKSALQQADVAVMAEDRDSPRASIFSPTARPPSRSSIILSPAATHKKSFSCVTGTHKRKASTVSDRSSCLFPSGSMNSSKKIRRTSLSSLSFTSNALAPIFSSAFMKSMNTGNGGCTGIDEVDEFGKSGNSGEEEKKAQGEVKPKRSLQRTVSFLSRM